MKHRIGLTALIAALIAPSAASAATARCRIEKPARATYGIATQNALEVKIDDLTATNLPKHHTFGGSPCATADRLAWSFEYELWSKRERPGVLETDPDESLGVPPLEWFPVYERGSEHYEGEYAVEHLTATFRHGHQRVSLRAQVKSWVGEAEGPGEEPCEEGKGPWAGQEIC